MVDETGSILTDTAAGAAAGSVVPGLGTIIGGLIGLAGGVISSIFQSNSANEQVQAQKAANFQNMQLNKQELAINQQNANTNQYAAQQNVRANNLASFNNTISGDSKLKKSLVDIWSGK
jgi:phage tail tape-measure protein